MANEQDMERLRANLSAWASTPVDDDLWRTLRTTEPEEFRSSPLENTVARQWVRDLDVVRREHEARALHRVRTATPRAPYLSTAALKARIDDADAAFQLCEAEMRHAEECRESVREELWRMRKEEAEKETDPEMRRLRLNIESWTGMPVHDEAWSALRFTEPKDFRDGGVLDRMMAGAIEELDASTKRVFRELRIPDDPHRLN